MFEAIINEYVQSLLTRAGGSPSAMLELIRDDQGTLAHRNFLVASALVDHEKAGTKALIESQFNSREYFSDLIKNTSFDLAPQALDQFLGDERVNKRIATGGQLQYNLLDTINVLREFYIETYFDRHKYIK